MRVFLCGVALAALMTPIFATSSADASALQDSLAASVNSYRASRGLTTVVTSTTLQAAAQFMADDVATYGPPLTPHVSSDGRTARQRMADAGYPVDAAFTSEIIAWGTPTVAGAMNLWLNSAPHWAQLNDGRYRAAGFGIACYGAYPCVWVVTFGTVIDGTLAPAAPAASFHSAFAAESAYPVAAPGQVVQWVIAFTNTGATGWSVDGGTALRLGTALPQDGPSALASAKWISFNRPAQQTTSFVAPGQQAWFIVELAAPTTPGAYRLNVRPVIEGVQWLEDAGAYVDLIVR